MRNQLKFAIPFSGFNSLSFSNCFASVFMYLEKTPFNNDYECKRRDGGDCDGCGNCHNTSQKIQEDFYFLFDTLTGRSSMRPDFDNDNAVALDSTPEMIDFLLKYAGYSYHIVTDYFQESIKASIDGGKPVIARVYNDVNFRVITGYDESSDSLLMPDLSNAQKKPAPPAYGDLRELLIFGIKTKPERTLIDGLKQIQTVMQLNGENKVWDNYIQKFKYWDSLKDAPFDELKRRYKRICDISWHNFNCHNFAEVFRHRNTAELKDNRLDEVCRIIDMNYDRSHTCNWQLIALNECRDWSNRRYNELEWGLCESVVSCLKLLKEYDGEVLAAVETAIKILEGNSI